MSQFFFFLLVFFAVGAHSECVQSTSTYIEQRKPECNGAYYCGTCNGMIIGRIGTNENCYATGSGGQAVNNGYGGNWYRCGVVGGTQFCCDNSCDIKRVQCLQDTNKVWDDSNCECKNKPPRETDSTLTVCRDVIYGGKTYSEVYVISCHYLDGVAQSCCGTSPSNVAGDGYMQYCPRKKRQNGSCAGNNTPPFSPPSPCQPPNCYEVRETPKDSSSGECYAVVGYTCYMQDKVTGNTFKCECDGSCDKAIREVIDGTCKNPYSSSPSSSPSSSGSGGDSSPSSSPSSSGSGGDSSPSSSPSSSSVNSSGSGGDNRDLLEQIAANTLGTMNNTKDISSWTQTTMDNTTDMKNMLSGIAVDVGHVRTNTEQTASNMGLINDKLTTTNNLLYSIGELINNKDFGGGDTNIVNITNNVDTSRAPKEILDLLKDGEPNYNDTVGTGREFDNIMNKIDSAIGDGQYIMTADSVKTAVEGLYNGGFMAVRDSLANSAISDSMAQWTDKLVNNGVISGNGSDGCPEILTRTWQIRFPIGTGGADVSIGPLGTIMCRDLAGIGITFWALCRVILRAMVAIACMMWLYKSVLGIDGGSNEED